MALKGVPRSEDVKKRISIAMIGKKKSEETKKKMSLAQKGNTHWLGKNHTIESKIKIGLCKIGKKRSEEVKNKISISCKGKNSGKLNGNYKHGKFGTNKYNRLSCKRYIAMQRYDGELSIETIEKVYEDNIKNFGKLTCYLCLVPITFNQDGLEHKIPQCKGGTNDYNNLAISCKSCNVKKRDRTEEEYRKSLLK